MNKKSNCHRCGSEVANYESFIRLAMYEGKIPIMTVDDAKKEAYWCPTCKGLLCTACARIKIKKGIGGKLSEGVCPVCKERVKSADEEQMDSPISESLNKQTNRSWFGKFLGK